MDKNEKQVLLSLMLNKKNMFNGEISKVINDNNLKEAEKNYIIFIICLYVLKDLVERIEKDKRLSDYFNQKIIDFVNYKYTSDYRENVKSFATGNTERLNRLHEINYDIFHPQHNQQIFDILSYYCDYENDHLCKLESYEHDTSLIDFYNSINYNFSLNNFYPDFYYLNSWKFDMNIECILNDNCMHNFLSNEGRFEIKCLQIAISNVINCIYDYIYQLQAYDNKDDNLQQKVECIKFLSEEERNAYEKLKEKPWLTVENLGKELSKSKSTVKTQLSAIYDKLNVKNIYELREFINNQNNSKPL